jgi:hypothetical protein
MIGERDTVDDLSRAKALGKHVTIVSITRERSTAFKIDGDEHQFSEVDVEQFAPELGVPIERRVRRNAKAGIPGYPILSYHLTDFDPE